MIKCPSCENSITALEVNQVEPTESVDYEPYIYLAYSCPLCHVLLSAGREKKTPVGPAGTV